MASARAVRATLAPVRSEVLTEICARIRGLMRVSTAFVVLALALAPACSSSSPPVVAGDGGTSSPGEGGAKNGPPADHVFGGARPVQVLRVPSGYDPGKPAPLVVVLHGYGATGTAQSLFFNLGSIADESGFFLVAPEGTTDANGRQFWNATDLCCDFGRTNVDDVAYLTGLVDEIATYYAIDPKRVFLVGHSNGGAMSFRLGCDASERFAAIVDLAGPFFGDASRCKPKQPVALLHMHGTKDETVSYEPESTGLRNPGALATVRTWASNNGCAAEPDTRAAPIDLDGAVPGAETKPSRFGGCRGGADVELWTMEGTSHVPFDLAKDLPKRIYAFLSAHPKP